MPLKESVLLKGETFWFIEDGCLNKEKICATQILNSCYGNLKHFDLLKGDVI